MDLEKIIGYLSEHMPGRPEWLTEKSRVREKAFFRFAVMYVVRNTTSMSLKEIGDLVGGRDHSTVIHALEQVADWEIADRARYRACQDAVELFTAPSSRTGRIASIEREINRKEALLGVFKRTLSDLRREVSEVKNDIRKIERNRREQTGEDSG